MTDFTVNFGELRDAGGGFDALHNRADSQLDRLTSIGLAQPDFGRIPWLQTRVFEAYSEHTADCAGSLTELAAALAATRDALTGCADAYESYDASAAEAIGSFFGGVV